MISNIVPCYNMLGEFYIAIQFAEKQLALARLYNLKKVYHQCFKWIRRIIFPYSGLCDLTNIFK